jgi:tripartite-type tricarboxylate transporter receptor subunit TctC
MTSRLHHWRYWLVALTAITAACLAAPAAMAQAQAVRLLVGFPPGGGVDVLARTLAPRLGEALGASVVVENRAGAGGQVAALVLKTAPADGNTLFLSLDHTISVVPLVMKSPGYDPARDFVAVAGVATFHNVLVVTGASPARTMGEYVALARSRGGKGNVGVPAAASMPEFLVRALGDHYGLDLTPVPYRGSAPVIADLLGNQIEAGIGSTADYLAHHQAGRVRVLAVEGPKRQPALPDVPTLAELGIAGFEDAPYYAVFAPAGTPPAVIARTSQAIAAVLAAPEVQERLTALGMVVQYMPPAEFAAYERAFAQARTRVIRSIGFQPQ